MAAAGADGAGGAGAAAEEKAGAGALCMVCHNTRNGARGDYVSTSSIGGPHAPVETDLFLGVNELAGFQAFTYGLCQ